MCNILVVWSNSCNSEYYNLSTPNPQVFLLPEAAQFGTKQRHCKTVKNPNPLFRVGLMSVGVIPYLWIPGKDTGSINIHPFCKPSAWLHDTNKVLSDLYAVARDPVTCSLTHAAHQWLQAEDQVMQLFGILGESVVLGCECWFAFWGGCYCFWKVIFSYGILQDSYGDVLGT